MNSARTIEPARRGIARNSRLRSTIRRGRDVGLSLPGRSNVAIADLVVPYRFDVVVRRRMGRALLDEPSLADISENRLVELAEETGYAQWFSAVEVELHRPALVGNDSLTRRGLVERAGGFARLLSLHEDAESVNPGPIVLNWHLGSATTSSGLKDAASLSLGDGCHRLAIKWMNGEREVAAGEHRRLPRLRLPVRDNTATLIGAGVVDIAEVIDVFSQEHEEFRSVIEGGASGPRSDEFGRWLDSVGSRAK